MKIYGIGNKTSHGGGHGDPGMSGVSISPRFDGFYKNLGLPPFFLNREDAATWLNDHDPYGYCQIVECDLVE